LVQKTAILSLRSMGRSKVLCRVLENYVQQKGRRLLGAPDGRTVGTIGQGARTWARCSRRSLGTRLGTALGSSLGSADRETIATIQGEMDGSAPGWALGAAVGFGTWFSRRKDRGLRTGSFTWSS